MNKKIYLVSPERAESGTLETLPQTNGIIFLKNDDLIKSDQVFKEDDLVCITSEASLDITRERIIDKTKKAAIELLK
ncbi:MAG: hypothetical protein HKN68_07685, partial [Saprospiraceae bacterium]|nr:hypothetical protein [Saprospiraceae bacterium]